MPANVRFNLKHIVSFKVHLINYEKSGAAIQAWPDKLRMLNFHKILLIFDL